MDDNLVLLKGNSGFKWDHWMESIPGIVDGLIHHVLASDMMNNNSK